MIKYFEVGLKTSCSVESVPSVHPTIYIIKTFSCLKEINGVDRIKDGYNPATWVLEVTTDAQEEFLGVKFAEIYKKSDLFQYVN